MNTLSKLTHRFELFPDDIFLVSYPKSGNTWLRFLLGNYQSNNDCSFRTLSRTSGEVYLTTPEAAAQMERPRLLKSHEPYTPDYRRVIYLARDGRDVAVSYYYFNLRSGKIDKSLGFPEFLTLFNAGAIGSYGNWTVHINAWLDHPPPELLLVKYEDMLADPVRELRRVLEFCQIPIEESRLEAAAEASSFEHMKQLEERDRQSIQRWSKLDPTIRFVRQGGQGNWKSLFTEELEQAFLDTHGDAMARLDYIPASEFRAMLYRQPTQHLGDRQETQRLQVEIQQLKRLYGRSQSRLEKLQPRLEKLRQQKQNLQKRLKQAQAELQPGYPEHAGFLHQWSSALKRLGLKLRNFLPFQTPTGSSD